MNTLLQRLNKRKTEEVAALLSKGEAISYRNLWEASDRIAGKLDELLTPSRRGRILVYGHKSPSMLYSFLGAMKSGRSYCPLDTSFPEQRILSIVKESDPLLMIMTEEANFDLPKDLPVLRPADVEEILSSPYSPYEGEALRDEEVFYTLFTSGSTGVPKGVPIRTGNLMNFLQWSETLLPSVKEGQVFLNQAPFSFDLSVMDVYTSLYTGGTLALLEKKTTESYADLLAFLRESNIEVWVSTPSFAELCLAADEFREELLPNLRLFFFCGEVLSKKTSALLMERFPKATVLNTYGPTESTVAVTEIPITKELLEEEGPLPVGRVKKGSRVRIMNGNEELPEGEKGEIVIYGNTLSPGYLDPNVKTATVFETDPGSGERRYRTGDLGAFRAENLYCYGRMDHQIKMHGYRIELEEIESALLRLPEIHSAVVLPKTDEEGKIHSLHGHITVEGGHEGDKAYARTLRKKLSDFLPAYMVPKILHIHTSLPMTNNGKVDRKALKEVLA